MGAKKKRKGLPTVKLEKFAKLALTDDTFRKAVSKKPGSKPGLRKAIHDELAKNTLGFKKMTEAEIAYCEGWMRLARTQFGDTHFDEKLVIAIQEEIERGYSKTMTG